MTFTPPASGSTRLSEDVWHLICTYAESNGNGSPREAIEQLIRRVLGNAQAVPLGSPHPPTSAEPSLTATTATIAPSNNAAAALDALLAD